MAEGRRSSQRYLSGRSKFIGFFDYTDRHLYVEPAAEPATLDFLMKRVYHTGTYYKLTTVPNETTFVLVTGRRIYQRPL